MFKTNLIDYENTWSIILWNALDTLSFRYLPILIKYLSLIVNYFVMKIFQEQFNWLYKNINWLKTLKNSLGLILTLKKHFLFLIWLCTNL